jgi:predicted ATPase/transcriptional regulator with XRE-family HTH domain
MTSHENDAAFGLLLRDLRLAAGLSQEVLAGRAALSRDAVSTLERGVRRYPQRETVARLATALGLDDAMRGRLQSAARRPKRPRRQSGGNVHLPAVASSFIGRDADIAAVGAALRAARLVTLAGTGGVGKTRLALACAGASATAFPDGVWFVDLAAVGDPQLVAPRAAQTLGIRAVAERDITDLLLETLAEARTLIVLDTCEHLRDAVQSLVEALLRRTAHVRVLATSRIPLGLASERVHRVAPLPVRDLTALPAPDDLRASPAVRLFVERAAAVTAHAPVRGDEWMSIATVCARVEGLPLGIELAAARASVLAPRALAAALAASTRVLSAAGEGRQSSLDRTIAWSDQLLQPAVRRVFRRLGVFEGRFTFAAACAVCAEPGEDDLSLLDALAHLVDASLVVSESAVDGRRFRLLGPIRDWVRAHDDERALLAERHARYQLRLVRDLAVDITDAATAASREEIDDVRAALRWALRDGHDPRLGASIAAFASPLWLRHELWSEGIGWLRTAVTAADDAATRASLWHGIAVHENRMNRPDAALAACRIAMQHAHESGSDERIAAPTIMYAYAAHRAGEIDTREAIAQTHDGIAAAQRAGRLDAVASAQIMLGLFYAAIDDTAQAEEATCAALAYYRRVGSTRAEATCLQNLAIIARNAGDGERALRSARAAIALLANTPQRIVRAVTQCIAAWLAAERGTLEDARADFAAARSAFVAEGAAAWIDEGTETAALLAFCEGQHADAVRAVGYFRARRERRRTDPPPRYVRAQLDDIIAESRARHGDAQVEAWLAEGAAMSSEQIVHRMDDLLASAATAPA